MTAINNGSRIAIININIINLNSLGASAARSRRKLLQIPPAKDQMARLKGLITMTKRDGATKQVMTRNDFACPMT